METTLLTSNILINLGFKKISGLSKPKLEFVYFELSDPEPSKCVIVRTNENNSFFSVFNRSECNEEDMQFITKVTYLHELDLVSKVLRKTHIQTY